MLSPLTTCLRTAETCFKNMPMKEVSEKRDLDLFLSQNKEVLALFCASWCPFCRSFFPSFDKEMPRHSFESIIRVYIDDDDNPLWDEYSLDAVPTVIFFENGKISRRLDARLGGGLSEKQFKEWLGKLKNEN